MRILYTRTAHQEAERDVEFCLDPFNQAEWHIKNSDIYHQLGRTAWDSSEEYCDTENIRLVTFDTAVIQDLWGAPISDLLAYIKEVRTDASNIVRSYETEVSLDGHRMTAPLHLKVHKVLGVDGVGFDAELTPKIVLYVEAEWYEELTDDDYRIYDAEQYEITTL
jgi:hypothetical protein